jgi:hypothetical protein
VTVLSLDKAEVRSGDRQFLSHGTPCGSPAPVKSLRTFAGPNCFKMFQNLLKSFKVFQSFSKFFKVFQSFSKFFKVF